MRKGRDSDDGSAARLAVMEGQATWLMSEYMAESPAGRWRIRPIWCEP